MQVTAPVVKAKLGKAHPRSRKEASEENLPTLGNVRPEEVAKKFLDSLRHQGVLKARYWAGTYWGWNGSRYQQLTQEDLKHCLVRFLKNRYSNIKSGDVANVLLNVTADCSVPSNFSMPRWLNGGDKIARHWKPEDMFATRSDIIHLPSLVAGEELYSVPATPKYFNSVAADYDFAIDATPPVRWLQFLRELFGEDTESVKLLQQWFGYCLTADTRQQKIMLMIGPKRSGKGTIASVLRSLVGDLNCCAPTLSGLATNFGLQPLVGKTLAIIGDARLSGRTDVAATMERLLSISGEDAQTIDRKHKEPITTQLRTRFTIISNELPRFNDASGALAGRLLILRLTQSFFGREDKGLREALHAERQSILLWAISGWESLRNSGRFIEPTSSRDLIEQMQAMASPITEFVSECCVVDPGKSVYFDLLYERFRKWSEKKGITRIPCDSVFSRDLTAAYSGLQRQKPTNDMGERQAAFAGIGLA